MSFRTRILSAIVLPVIVLSACEPGTPTPVPPTFTPNPTPVPAQSNLPIVPQDFRITLVSDQPKIGTAILRDGNYFYVTELRTGNVIRLADTDGDGKLDSKVIVATGFNVPRYLAINPKTGELYVSGRGQINALRDTNGDGIADENRVVIKGLYDLDYMHTNNGIAFGPDGKLYIADGAPRLKRLKKLGPSVMEQYAGTVLVANPDGSDVQVYAHGFRNPFGLTFAADGSLYATDNGEDSVPQKYQGDELNRIVAGGDFGYPDVLGDPPPGSQAVAPLVNFIANSAPTAVLSYDAQQFPADYRGDLFVALWNIGHKIVHVSQQPDGKYSAQDFITNLKFPVGMTLGADGSLYVLDMSDGVDGSLAPSSHIYRVEYEP